MNEQLEQAAREWHMSKYPQLYRDSGPVPSQFTIEANAADVEDLAAFHEHMLSLSPPVTVPSQVKALLEKAKASASGCTCHELYRSRGLIDPECAACDFNEVMGYVDQALTALASAPQEGQEGWIPVSERLPDELGEREVAFLYHPEWAPFKEGKEAYRVSACRASSIVYDAKSRTDGTTPFASHWMPLPDAPKPHSDPPDPELP